IGGEVLCPARATALGVGKIAPSEYPQLSFRSIDIVLPVECGLVQGENRVDTRPPFPFTPSPIPTDEERLVDQIMGELRSGFSEREVAYRGSHRWVRYIEPVRLEAVTAVKQPLGLRPQGVYLITGGLGGIGLALAEDLASRVQAKLVLIGRTA